MTTLEDEFQRQIETLLDIDFPSLTGLSTDQFVSMLSPLEKRLDDIPAPSHDQSLPFVIVIKAALVPTETVIQSIVDGQGKRGVVNMTPLGPDDFAPRPGTELPPSSAYLLADIDIGAESLGVRPKDALVVMEARQRLPLTIDEGVAVLTHHPDVLRTHNAYQLLASRRADKRIPSIWTSYGQPRLGWCWDGNPHTWMGSASAAARLS